ncbi:MAG: HdeD family acid-resistance protein [Lachnospira sp.]
MNLMKKIKEIKNEMIIISLALLVLGVFMIIFPETSQELLCRSIGIVLCIWGVFRLIAYFKTAGQEVLASFGLVQGVSLLAFGIFFVMKPDLIATLFGVALAILIIIDGVLKLQYAVEFYHLKTELWWVELIVAAVVIIMGIIALLNPFSATSTLMIFMGILFVIEGITDLIAIIRISGAAKKFAEAVKDAMR